MPLAPTTTREEALSLLFPFEPGDSLDSDWWYEDVQVADNGDIRFRFQNGDKRLELIAGEHPGARVLANTRRYYLSYRGRGIGVEDEPFLRQAAGWIDANDQDRASVPSLGALVSPPDLSLTPEGPSLDFSISNLCNNNCTFCTNRPTDVQALDQAEVFRRLDMLRASGQTQVEFSAMEPTLRPDLPEILSRCRDLGFSPVHVITNGHRLKDAALARRLVQAGMSKVTISFHAHTPELEKAITRNPKSFENKVAAITHLQTAYREEMDIHDPGQMPVFLTAVINRLNVPYLDNMLAFFHSLGVVRVAYYFPRHTGAALQRFEEVVPSYQETKTPLLNAIAYARQHQMLFRIQDLPPCVLAETVEEAGQAAPWLGIRLKKTVTVQRPGEAVPEAFFSDVADEKTKGPPCKSCEMEGYCEGVFAPYIHRRGWAGFEAIRS